MFLRMAIHVCKCFHPFNSWLSIDELYFQVIAQMTPPAIANTGWKIYILFCVLIALSIPFVYFFVPEVRGALKFSLLNSSYPRSREHIPDSYILDRLPERHLKRSIIYFSNTGITSMRCMKILGCQLIHSRNWKVKLPRSSELRSF
jgi:hypothetical protein